MCGVVLETCLFVVMTYNLKTKVWQKIFPKIRNMPIFEKCCSITSRRLIICEVSLETRLYLIIKILNVFGKKYFPKLLICLFLR